MRGSRTRAAFAALGVLVLLLTLAPAGTRPIGAPVPTSAGEIPTVDARPAGNTSINDIISLNATPPVGTFAPGSLLQVSYRVTLNTTTPTPAATVYIPGLLASFPAVPGTVTLFLPPHNLTMGTGGTVSASPTAFSLRNTTSFNGSRLAGFNSELVSLMSSLPFGAASVVVQWNWTMRTANGATTTSGWVPTNAPTIHPAQVAFLQSLEPRTLVPPAAITACLNGPVQGRTFSLHAETPKPFNDFVANTTRNPISGPSTFCLTVVIPASITPQNILMHIWDYESVTLLLYNVKVKVVNATAPVTAGPSTGWTTYADGALGVGAVGLAAAVVVVVRREPPADTRPPAEAPPPPPER